MNGFFDLDKTKYATFWHNYIAFNKAKTRTDIYHFYNKKTVKVWELI